MQLSFPSTNIRLVSCGITQQAILERIESDHELIRKDWPTQDSNGVSAGPPDTILHKSYS